MPPGFMNSGTGGQGRYSNPFYGVPFQFLPQNVDHMLWWANHFLFRFPFYKTVLGRVANYFVTAIKIECDDADAKRKYDEIFADMQWKQILGTTGLNLLAYGNSFSSITQGFDRFLLCSGCKRISNIERIDDYEFNKEGQYSCKCKGCNKKTPHEVLDKPSKDLKKLEVIQWNPREIKVRHDHASNASQYFWDIPQSYVNKVLEPNNKFYSKKTPKSIFDAIIKKKMLSFNDKNFIHLRVPSPSGIPTEGKSIPPCIYMFDDFFMLKVLERYNQALMFEDIVPFRVFSMAEGGAGGGNMQVNAILHQSAPQWQSAVKNMIKEHRLDPASYHLFPFTFQYQHLGADGKTLAPTELIQNTIGNILNALNIPQELYTMSLQTQAMGPALRLFENSWSFIVDIYNQMLGKWADIIRKINGLPKAKVTLMPVTLSDDIERKSIISQLVSANSIARSELLKLYGFDFREQVRKKFEEDDIMQEMQEEAATKKQIQQMVDGGGGGGGGGGSTGSTPGDVLEQATQIAEKLFPLDGAQRREELQKIKATDQTLYAAVKHKLDEKSSGAEKDGLAQSKAQSQQPGAQ